MPKAKSKAQASLFGYIAGGGDGRFKGFSPAEAKERLRGVKYSKLPERKGELSEAIKRRKAGK